MICKSVACAHILICKIFACVHIMLCKSVACVHILICKSVACVHIMICKSVHVSHSAAKPSGGAGLSEEFGLQFPVFNVLCAVSVCTVLRAVFNVQC